MEGQYWADGALGWVYGDAGAGGCGCEEACCGEKMREVWVRDGFSWSRKWEEVVVSFLGEKRWRGGLGWFSFLIFGIEILWALSLICSLSC